MVVDMMNPEMYQHFDLALDQEYWKGKWCQKHEQNLPKPISMTIITLFPSFSKSSEAQWACCTHRQEPQADGHLMYLHRTPKNPSFCTGGLFAFTEENETIYHSK